MRRKFNGYDIENRDPESAFLTLGKIGYMDEDLPTHEEEPEGCSLSGLYDESNFEGGRSSAKEVQKPRIVRMR